MRTHKLIIAATLLAAATLTLTACVPNGPAPINASSANPQAAKLLWFNTTEGAVKCLTYQIPVPTYRSSTLIPNHDCNWSTLKTGKVAGAETLPGASWLNVDGQEVFCLTEEEISPKSESTYNYAATPHYNCDWQHIKATDGVRG